MSDTEKSARPRQLTVAGGFVVGGSIFLVLSVFDTITSLHSVEMRDEITKVLSSPTGEGLGLSVGQALSIMRVGLMVAGACAAAAAVLGVYVFQRSRPARLALSILAVPILLTAPLTGGVVGALVAAATLMLWSGPARDWFAGRPVREAEQSGRSSDPRSGGRSGKGTGSSSDGRANPWETTMPPAGERNRGQGADQADQAPSGPEAGGPAQDTPPVDSLTTAGSSSQPGAMVGYGERPGLWEARDGTWLPPAYDVVVRESAAPPVAVKIACVLTWVFSGLVALLYLGMAVALVAAQNQVVDFVVKQPEWQRADLKQDMILPVLWLGCLMFLGWSLGACALAWFTWRRHNWARWLLVASAAAALVAALFAFPFGMLHQLAAALTIGGLVGPATRAWFGDSDRAPGPPPPPGWAPHEGHHPPQSGQEQASGQVPPGGKPPVW